MPRRSKQQSGSAPDDQPIPIIKRDLSGGMNNRQHSQMIAENQAVLLQNIMLETAGQEAIRAGATRIDSTYPYVSLLTDGGFELWNDSTHLTNWTAYLVTPNRTTSKVHSGTYSVGITYVSSGNAIVYQSYAGYASLVGKTVTFGCWVWCATPGVAYITITDGSSTYTSPYHTGNSQWQYLTVSYTVLNTASVLNFNCDVTGTGTAYYDDASATYPVNSSGYGLFGFNPDGGTFELMAMQNGALSGWPSSGTFISRKTGFTDGIPTTMIKAGQQTQLDVLIVSNGTDNPQVMYQDHSFHDMLTNQYYSMPKTKAICYYGDRVWALKNNLLPFSDAFPATYFPTAGYLVGDQTTYAYTTGDAISVTVDSVTTDNISLSGCSTISQVASAINTACGGTYATVGAYPNPTGVLVITSPTVGTSSIIKIDDSTSMKTASPVKTCIKKLFFTATTSTNGYAPFDLVANAFRVPVGTAQALIATRDQGIVAMGTDQIWQLLPSQVPNPVTDQPQKVLDIGCVAGKTAVMVADDIIFLAYDGIRGLFRTQLDKLQTGQSFPLSYPIPDQIGSINWAAINKATAVFFDNKYIISLPTNGSSYNNLCLVYYPALSTAMYASTNQSNVATSKSWVVYTGWNIADFAVMDVGGTRNLYGIDSVTGKVRQLLFGSNDDGNAISYVSQSRAEDFKAPAVYKTGGEFKIRALGGNGTIVASANPDGYGWIQLGSLSLSTTGVTFPTTFPVNFPASTEIMGVYHLENYGINRFKRCQFGLACTTLNADVAVIETLATAFGDDYISEDTYPSFTQVGGTGILTELGDNIITESGDKIDIE